MKINLITQKEYNKLIRLYKDYPALTFQNNGYQYIDKSKFNEEENQAFAEVTEILKNSVFGFSEFSNFRQSKDGKPQIRLQYNYSHDESGYFIGVGYVLIDELLNGFKETENK